MSYEQKYLKYKNKYLSLKNSTFDQNGGSFFKMPSFTKPATVIEVNQNTVQNEIINLKKLTDRIKEINSKINDKTLTEKLQTIDTKWKEILDILVNQLKTKDEYQKRYNGLLKEFENKQKTLNITKSMLDSYPGVLDKTFKDAKTFISSVEADVKKSEALLVQHELKISQNIARNEFNNIVHQRRASLSEEKHNRSRSSSTSSLKSLGTTP
jgi:DNA-binding transcriptional regulator YhcF (GntR family)